MWWYSRQKPLWSNLSYDLPIFREYRFWGPDIIYVEIFWFAALVRAPPPKVVNWLKSISSLSFWARALIFGECVVPTMAKNRTSRNLDLGPPNPPRKGQNFEIVVFPSRTFKFSGYGDMGVLSSYLWICVCSHVEPSLRKVEIVNPPPPTKVLSYFVTHKLY